MTCTACLRAIPEDLDLDVDKGLSLLVADGNMLVYGCDQHQVRLRAALQLGLRAEETLARLRERTEIWQASMRRVVFLNQLAVILGGSESSFTGRLLELCAHADPGNLAKLRALYPDVVLAWKAWTQGGPCEDPLTPAQLWARISKLAETEL